jgi:YD repeat-containing protein
VVFLAPSGYRVRFDKNAFDGYARAEPGVDATLRPDGTGYVLEWHSKQRYVFDGDGKLLRSEDKQGNKISYNRDLNGVLDHMVDTQGRRINFTYNGTSGLVDTVTDVPGGRTYDYDYDTFGDGVQRLKSVKLTSYGLGTDVFLTS